MTVRARNILVVVSVAALAGAGAWWLRRDDAERRPLVTATVERSPLEATVAATGTLNAVITVAVGTYVSGRIREIYADFNSPVTRGEVVAKIDPDPFEVKVEQAQARVATARARVERALADRDFEKSSLERQRRLSQSDVVSQDALDRKLNEYRRAEAQLSLERAAVAEAEAALEEARINLRYTDIVSPVNGVVLSRNVDVGQTVAASFQTPTLFLIAEDLTQMRVNANISESDIGRVRVAQPVRFTVDAYPEREFVGEVSQLRAAPVIEQSVVTYDVVIDVDNTDLALMPGMTATASITTDRREDAIVAPLRALRFRPDPIDRPGSGAGDDAQDDGERAGAGAGEAAGGGRESFVWVVEGDRALRRVRVETGIRSDRFVEVLDGALSVGDTLALAYERE